MGDIIGNLSMYRGLLMETEKIIEDIIGHHPSRLSADHYGTILIAKAIVVLALIIGRCFKNKYDKIN